MKTRHTQSFLALVFALFLVSSVQAGSVPLTSISAIAVGHFHTCALTSAGGVQCWGFDGNGELGDNSTGGVNGTRLTPVAVSGLSSGVTAIAAGADHTCALTSVGGVWCWGYDYYGQLGDNSTGDINHERLTPVAVSGLGSGVTAIAAGASHTCALTSAGGVWCWGYDYSGELGDNSTGDVRHERLTPVAVTGLSSGVTAIAAGWNHTCALTGAGGVWCWGNDVVGELGDNSSGHDRLTPVAVSGLGSGVTAIAAGADQTCALTSTGGVWCWGDDEYGQLGDNSRGDVNNERLTPVAVSGLGSGVTAIAAGEQHTCALTSAGGVWCWGYDYYGELGDNSRGDVNHDRLAPVAVTGLSSGVTAIAVGQFHTCALTGTSGVQCWGWDNYGELGDNSRGDVNHDRLTPVAVTGLSSGVTAIAAGDWHTCALTSAGGVKCWGLNNAGQLGDDTVIQRLAPVDVIEVFKLVKNDFDGVGKSDVLFLNSTTGGTQYWKAATKSQAVYPGVYDTSYTYAGSGDFDGDGKADILFTKSSDNGTLYWSGAAKSAVTYPGISSAGFTVAAICDTNGDGKDDVVWLNATTGGTQIWPAATKASVTYPGTQATGYSVAACADFDGDGKADLFWRNNTTGADEIWLSGNKSTKTYPGIYPDLTWTVIGAGDIDADGKSDVVWYQATTGKTMVWKSGLKSAATYPGANATTFTPKAIGDYDGDGKADLLWSNDTTLGTQIWSGVVKSAVTYPGTYTAGFTIQK